MGAHDVTLSLLELAARDMGSSADGSDPEQDKAAKPKPKASGKLKRGVSLYSLSGAPTGVSSPFAPPYFVPGLPHVIRIGLRPGPCFVPG